MKSFTNVGIVVATLNERENLPGLVVQLRQALPGARILVIDDNSQDGTADWLVHYQSQDPQFDYRIRVGVRGLGSATLFGIRLLRDQGYEWVGTLDADGSHDPQVFPVLLADTFQPNHQKVGVWIGSRYVSGGRIENWPWIRHGTSRSANLFSRYVIGLKARDSSGAFRLYRAAILKESVLEQMKSTGYGYLQEILFLLQRQGVEFREFPITFRNREVGKSKVTLREAARALANLWGLARRRFQ